MSIQASRPLLASCSSPWPCCWAWPRVRAYRRLCKAEEEGRSGPHHAGRRAGDRRDGQRTGALRGPAGQGGRLDRGRGRPRGPTCWPSPANRDRPGRRSSQLDPTVGAGQPGREEGRPRFPAGLAAAVGVAAAASRNSRPPSWRSRRPRWRWRRPRDRPGSLAAAASARARSRRPGVATMPSRPCGRPSCSRRRPRPSTGC